MMNLQRFCQVCPGVLWCALVLLLVLGAPGRVRAQQPDPPDIQNLHVALAVPPPPPLDAVPGVTDSVIREAAISQAPYDLSREVADLIAGDEPFLPGLEKLPGGGRIDLAPKFPGIDWSKTAAQSLFLLGFTHTYRLIIEPDTRAALGGPFWKDYFNAIKQLRGWSDGDTFLTNYIGHAMLGATAGRILIQNDPRGRDLEPKFNREYFKSRMKAFGYSVLFSAQFEVGLISEGTIGNATPNEYSRHPFSYQDLVITPTIGTAWLVGEDLIDKYIVRKIENWTENRLIRLLSRGLLTPTRAFANIMRLKYPWHRDDRRL